MTFHFTEPDGCNCLPSLSNFICTFQGNNFTCCYPYKSLISDLIWWRTTLSHTHVSHTPTSQGHPTDLHISVDASTSWGIGIFFRTQWDACQTSPSRKGPSHDISWLEGVSLKLIIYVLEEKGFCNSQILVHSDNQGVMTKVEVITLKLIYPFIAQPQSSQLATFPSASIILSQKRTQQTQYCVVSWALPQNTSSRLSLSLKSSNPTYCMYRYKLWTLVAHPVTRSNSLQHPTYPSSHSFPPTTTLLNILLCTSHTQSITPVGLR